MRGKSPWRYRCPECGSVSVWKRVNIDGAFNGRAAEARWWCHNCNESSDRVVDAKTGAKV